MTSSVMGRAATAYVSRFEWLTFPLMPWGKDPIVPKREGGRGYQDATLDLEQIRRWWQRWPEANVGIACSEASGLLALDVDPRHDGDVELAALEARCGQLPTTVTQHTGGGGLHYLFRRPKGVTFRGQLCRGVDVKANGYIVAAPSVHPNGTPYAWDAGAHPLETELAELPSWVLQRILSFQPAGGVYGESADDAARSFLALAFGHAGWLGKRIDGFRINCRCPWEDQHSVKSGSGGTVIFAPRQGKSAGWFHCSHESHGKKTMRDVLAMLPDWACRKAAADVAARLAQDSEGDAEERRAIQQEGQL